jgi:hypothetical protein
LRGAAWPEQPSPRFIIHRLLRRKELCPESHKCPEVLNQDPYAEPGALPCEGCPQQALSEYLDSPAGRLFGAVIDLDYALQAGVTITLEEIPYTVFLLLRQMSEERNAYELEQIKKQQQQHRAKR